MTMSSCMTSSTLRNTWYSRRNAKINRATRFMTKVGYLLMSLIQWQPITFLAYSNRISCRCLFLIELAVNACVQLDLSTCTKWFGIWSYKRCAQSFFTVGGFEKMSWNVNIPPPKRIFVIWTPDCSMSFAQCRWHASVVRMSVFGRRSFPELHATYG